MPPTPNTHIVDEHVGAQIRMHRKLRGVTQVELAGALDLTFQQVQKYERGSNRISASTLYATARFLGLPVAAFFEGLPATHDAARVDSETRAAEARAFLGTDEGLELASVFPHLSRKQRRAILTLAGVVAAEAP